MVFIHFAQISTDFSRILRDFSRIFTKSKVLGVRFHPASYNSGSEGPKTTRDATLF